MKFNLLDDDQNIFGLDEIDIAKPSDICTPSVGSEKSYPALQVEVVLKVDLIDQIASDSYTIRIVAMVRMIC